MSQRDIVTFGGHNRPFWQGIPDKQREKTALDTLRGTWVTERGVELNEGDPVPGYPGMIIFGLNEKDTGGSIRWRIDAQGSLKNNRPTKYIRRSGRRTLDEGWDQRTMEVITYERDSFQLGSVHPNYANLYLYDRDEGDEFTDWVNLNLTYKGLEWEKPVKRRINGAVEQTDSTFNGLSILTGNTYTGFPPLSTGQAILSGTNINVSYSAPGITVTDTFISTQEPPTDYIGQFWSPTNPPAINSLGLAGTTLRYHFPFGWRCQNIVSENIPGVTLWLVTITWEYQRPSTPTT